MGRKGQRRVAIATSAAPRTLERWVVPYVMQTPHTRIVKVKRGALLAVHRHRRAGSSLFCVRKLRHGEG